MSIGSQFRRWRRLLFGWRWFRGNYPTWAAARAASAGYDDAPILDRVVLATREVRAGRALWERDGTLFHVPEINEPLLKALTACAKRGDRFEVVDFGGSLGSTWWQHRAQLADLRLSAWRVVEQEHYVQAGAEFANDILSFHHTLEEACVNGAPTVILFSGVLQCVESPSSILHAAARTGTENIVLDRTPFVKRGGKRLAVQHTPSQLGGGTYPCWHFVMDELLAPLRGNYDFVEDWPSLDDLDLSVRYRGLLMRRLPSPTVVPK